MLIHVQDAGQSWCPFGRRPFGDESTGYAAVNRKQGEKPMETSPCIGTRCMGWRWAEARGDDEAAVAGMGYCGLAGQVRA